jgi:hypothetical protein
MTKRFIFPREEFPEWSDNLRGLAAEFWQKWIGPNRVGYDEAIQDIGELIDYAINSSKQTIPKEGEELRQKRELNELEAQLERYKKYCAETKARDGCGYPTFYTLGCSECILATQIKTIRKQISEYKTLV